MPESKESPAEKCNEAASLPNKRPRGRPLGSKKNDPNSPIVISREIPDPLQHHVLEISSGADIVESLSDYVRRRGRGISVLRCGGAVKNVTFRQPPPENAMTLQGHFEIVSLSGAILPTPAPPESGRLSIILSDGEGKLVGGRVMGKLEAFGTVVVIGATFANAVFERLPLEEEDTAAGQSGSQSSSGGD